jgi:hypothetical protein
MIAKRLAVCTSRRRVHVVMIASTAVGTVTLQIIEHVEVSDAPFIALHLFRCSSAKLSPG